MPPGDLPLRTRLGLRASRFASGLSAALGRGRGTVIGGAIATRVDPRTLERLAAGRTTAIVSATNGKSTTTAMLAAAARTLGPVAHNGGGSNMESGLIVALDGARRAPIAILEADELYLGPLARATHPCVITLMNLARDYLERGVRYKRLVRHWRDTFTRVDWPLTIVANADDPLVVWSLRPVMVGGDGPDRDAGLAPVRLVWVAGGHRWAGDGLVCRDDLVALQRDGPDWWCEVCGRRRPGSTWSLAEGIVHGPGIDQALDLGMPGDVNEVNALFALITAVELGIPADVAARSFTGVVDVDGRYGRRMLDGRAIRLLLSKNPASWQESVNIIEATEEPVVFDITARGDLNARDTSFVWEAPIERLAGRRVIATGIRAHDIALRLETAGLEVTAIPDPFDAIRACPPGPVTVATNYPAFLELRDALPREADASTRATAEVAS
ncbi:MAG TPA: MurT ligase domain-containing protein [Candidatus Limnocylindrales bacterium]|nr:MurT ligase domain-containing protein [Candidatus Limnocylindrales bacterium]